MKEDELMAKRKGNKKRRDTLESINSAIRGCDKENLGINVGNVRDTGEDKLKILEERKLEVNKGLNEGVNVLLKLCEEFESLSEVSTGLKKELAKDWELSQEVKAHKNSLFKTKDMLNVPAAS